MPFYNPLKLNERITKALEDYDAESYASLIMESGRKPEDPYLFEQGLLELSLGSPSPQTPDSEHPQKPTKLEEFVSKAKERGLHKSSIFEYPSSKKQMLREYLGLERVCVSKGKYIPIEEADPARIGIIFRDRIRSLERRKL